jgi:RNA polymerase sigma factor (sigma-70 family)
MTTTLPEPGTDSFLPTRQSLLSRLRDCGDDVGWREFFENYWRLIYNVARKFGLADAEAQDVVQSTFIYLTRKMPKFQYDPARGSFKSWLRVVTRSRIQVHRRQESSGLRTREAFAEGDADGLLAQVPDPSGDALDEVWQREWEENLLEAALRRVRAKVSARHLLMFRLTTLNGLALTQVARKLDVSVPQVYMARHRVGKLFKAEVAQLRREAE